MDNKKDIPQEVREYMSSLGKRGGATNRKKGPEFFRWVVSHRKNVREKRQRESLPE